MKSIKLLLQQTLDHEINAQDYSTSSINSQYNVQKMSIKGIDVHQKLVITNFQKISENFK